MKFLSTSKKKFDVIGISGVLHHLTDYNQIIASIAKRLKSSGLFFITHEPLKQDVKPSFRLTMHNLIQYFPYIITADHVSNAKPDPEIFLKAAEMLNLMPRECVVVEDAILGIQAAKNAGMYVISIPNEFTEYQDHSIADLRLNSITQLNNNILKNLGE